jgi:zinc D-Ala-D-Ala carboxypeptidase
MSDVMVRSIQQRLNRMGFGPIAEDGLNGPSTRLAVARFQTAYNAGNRLAVDGQYGPFTLAALDFVDSSGKISANFSLNEVRSKGDRTAWIHRDILSALETLRSRVGRPLSLVSAWRDVAHNRRVGGARTSVPTYGSAPELEAIKGRFPAGSHLLAGKAADFNRGYITLEDLKAMRLFTGIGWRRFDGKDWVTHVDVRPGNPANPTVWQYR